MNSGTLIDVRCSLSYAVCTPASFVFNIAAASTDHQSVLSESLRLSPDLGWEWCTAGEDGYRSARTQAEPGTISVEYTARVESTPDVDPPRALQEVRHAQLPGFALPFLNPSRYCESDRLGRFANKELAQTGTGHARVAAICDWVNAHIDYVPGSTDASSSACDVLLQRAGVCRDFAHVGIALCRALGIPARYVSGYAVGLDPPDFHGFFEAFLGERWYLFDATKKAPMSGFVRIGTGRDAADASFTNVVGQTFLQDISVSAVSAQADSLSTDESLAISSA